MSKTFKSVKSTLELTVVRTNEDLVRIITQLPDETGRAIDLAPSDAPALALAILEVAGIAESSDAGVAAEYLRAHMAEQERATAEAKEQAELEAEALKLFNAWRKSCNLMIVEDWDIVPSFRSEWLAVARKAREIGAKK